MKEYSVIMAVCDFIPVALFIAAAVILQRCLFEKMSKGAFALFAGGTINVAAAGTLKALYKLLYALGVCDFPVLSDIFMPLQSLGFLLAGSALLASVIRHKDTGADKVLAAAPPVVSGTFLFIGCMVAGLAAMLTALSVLAARKKKGGAVALFIVAFVCSLCMGYLSSRDFDKALFNWIAEGVNIAGQGTLLLGSIILSKAYKAEA